MKQTKEPFIDFPTALDALASELRGRKFSPTEYYIALTPDRYTLQVEKALFSGSGAIDCEVLTLSRLCRRVCGSDVPLSREGGVMLVAKAIANVKDELKYYGKAAKYYDFAREAYETLLQIAASDVDISTVAATGSTAGKLSDLAVISAEYEKLKADYKDSPDRLRALIAAAPTSALIRDSRFYAIGFSNPTKLNKAALHAIEKSARSFEYYDAAKPTGVRDVLEIYRAPDAITQYKAIAMRIRELITKNERYGDISVVCSDVKPLTRILREYDINFYADTSVPLAETPPLAALACIYKLRTSAESDKLVALCKNPFSGCDGYGAEKLQAYIRERGLDYNCFGIDIPSKAARLARERAKLLVDAFNGSFTEACEKVLELGEFEEIQSKLYKDDTDMITPIRSLLRLLDALGGDDFDECATIFFSAAKSLEVKSLPRSRDRVSVVPPQSLRMTRCKYLFIADFIEGVQPVVTSDGGLLSDSDLTALGEVIEPTAREKNIRDREELRAVMNNAQHLFCAYHTANGAKPSSLLVEYADEVRAYHRAKCSGISDDELDAYIASKVIESDYDEELAVLNKELTAVNFIARFASVTSAARELAARKMTPLYESIERAVGKSDKVSPPFADKIKGGIQKRSLSVSELTDWFNCPYKRFLRGSVGLKERRDGRLAAPDFGVIVHEFMRRFIESKPLDCSRDAVEKIIDEVLPSDIRITEIERERIISDAVDYARLNKDIIEAGDYIPALTEHRFGGELTLGDTAGLDFSGIIDRVDYCGDHARIIDYKTGDKKFEIKKCISGLDMQLPLYAAAIEGDGKTVTGVFYVPLRRAYDEDNTRMSGCMIGSPAIAYEYDEALRDGARSSVIPVTTKFKDDGIVFDRPNKQSLLDVDVFDALIDRCVDTASGAADEIASGYIKRTPAKGACDYCAFAGICGGAEKPRA